MPENAGPDPDGDATMLKLEVTDTGEPHSWGSSGLLGGPGVVGASLESEGKHSPEQDGAREHVAEQIEVMLMQGLERTNAANEVWEIYSPPRVVPVAKRKGFGAGWSMDLTTEGPDGSPWDFDCPVTRQRARGMIAEQKPALLIASPMCTYLSTVMRLAKLQLDPEEYRRRRIRAVMHLQFTFELLEMQHNAGRYFLLEHLAYADTWGFEFVQQLVNRSGIHLVLAHQCRFGLRGTDKHGPGLVKKPTKFLTNAREIAKALDKQCTGCHRHLNTMGTTKLLSACAIYPPGLCSAIVRGLERQLEQDQRRDEVLSTELGSELPELARDDSEDLQEADILQLIAPELMEDEDLVAYDDAKGGTLHMPPLRKARDEEMEFVKSRNIYSYASVKDCVEKTGRNPIGTKWVDTNKGDDQNPKYRSRLVATEVRKPWSEKWFAATPPVEALRFLLALAARGSKSGTRKTSWKSRQVLLLDVSRAHWYPDAAREIFVKLPPEDPRSSDPDL